MKQILMSWSFPDSKILSGHGWGTSVGGDFTIRTKKNPVQPNIPDTYVPAGIYLMTYKVTGSGRFVVQMF